MGEFLNIRKDKCPNSYYGTIIIITEESFNTTNGLQTCMNKLYELIKNNRNSRFIYGGSDRINYHVEKYAETFLVPLSYLVPIDVFDTELDKFRKSDYIANLVKTSPSRLVVFADNTTNLISGLLIDRCKNAGIDIDIITSSGDMLSSYNCSPSYYSSQSRVDHSEFFINEKLEERPDGNYRHYKREV